MFTSVDRCQSVDEQATGRSFILSWTRPVESVTKTLCRKEKFPVPLGVNFIKYPGSVKSIHLLFSDSLVSGCRTEMYGKRLAGVDYVTKCSCTSDKIFVFNSADAICQRRSTIKPRASISNGSKAVSEGWQVDNARRPVMQQRFVA